MTKASAIEVERRMVQFALGFRLEQHAPPRFPAIRVRRSRVCAEVMDPDTIRVEDGGGRVDLTLDDILAIAAFANEWLAEEVAE